MARKRTIEPKAYLEYLLEMWDPRTAAKALGCAVADIVALQKSTLFVEEFLRQTVQWSGPAAMADLSAESLRDMLDRDKFANYLQLKELTLSPDTPEAVKARILTEFFRTSMTMEGVSQRIQVDQTVTHRLDPESAKALEAARMESARLIAAPIDVKAERV